MSLALQLFRHRDSASTAGTVLLMLAFAVAISLKPHLPSKVQAETVMEIRMLEEAPPAPPPPKPLPAPTPAPKLQAPSLQPTPPKPAVKEPARTSPNLTPNLAPSAPSPTPASAPISTTAPAVSSAPALPAKEAAPAKPVEAPPPAPKPAAQISDGYIAKLRAYVQGRKRYPTGREASLAKPTGTVRAWLLLNRQGEMQDVGVERSSDSIILDSEALKLLRSGHYPAFPDEAFPGQGTHKFYFDLDYQRSGEN